MAGPRINQFADDLGINRSSAKKLMKKARGRKDGGSETLEKHMSSVAKPQTKEEDEETKERMRKKFDRSKKLREAQEAEINAKDGKYMSCRGMGKAIQGGKFRGVS
jgi:hypothetical protein|tara:strand:- start:526 stop:843 length:318 start_codon:yes stop_codon:yes gene_type:complete